jgi:hypothetical protein
MTAHAGEAEDVAHDESVNVSTERRGPYGRGVAAFCCRPPSGGPEPLILAETLLAKDKLRDRH